MILKDCTPYVAVLAAVLVRVVMFLAKIGGDVGFTELWEVLRRCWQSCRRYGSLRGVGIRIAWAHGTLRRRHARIDILIVLTPASISRVR